MLDWHDIQGNILRGYPRHPYARFMPFHLRSPDSGRNFLRELGPLITRGHWGDDRPKATTNVALSFTGLAALDLPFESLATFPPEFQQGMRSRAKTLGDTGESDPQRWHPPWNADRVDLV